MSGLLNSQLRKLEIALYLLLLVLWLPYKLFRRISRTFYTKVDKKLNAGDPAKDHLLLALDNPVDKKVPDWISPKYYTTIRPGNTVSMYLTGGRYWFYAVEMQTDNEYLECENTLKLLRLAPEEAYELDNNPQQVEAVTAATVIGRWLGFIINLILICANFLAAFSLGHLSAYVAHEGALPVVLFASWCALQSLVTIGLVFRHRLYRKVAGLAFLMAVAMTWLRYLEVVDCPNDPLMYFVYLGYVVMLAVTVFRIKPKQKSK
jgi:hypothetical protein